VIRESIEDLSNNTTRFLIIGKSQCLPTGNDKTSIVFSVADKPGALYLALKPFFENNINLTKVESRPTRRNSWEYNFFIDFHGHEKDEVISKVLSELRKEIANYESKLSKIELELKSMEHIEEHYLATVM